MRVRTVLAGCFVGLATAAPATAAEPQPYQLEVGPTFTYVKRSAKSDGSGVEYAAGTGPGLQLRAGFLPWLRVAARYQQTSHDASFSPGALGIASSLTSGSMVVDTLGAYLQPTFTPVSRLHTWASAGLAWSHVSMPNIDTGDGAHLRHRTGVFQEWSLGVGASFDVLPGWVALSLDLQWAKPVSETGDLFSPDVYYDAQGTARAVPSFPTFATSLGAMFGVMLTL